MSDAPAPGPFPETEQPGKKQLSLLGLVALLLAGLSAVSLVIVLIGALLGQVLWSGFTLFPAICFPVAFMLMCVELARTALRRRRT